MRQWRRLWSKREEESWPKPTTEYQLIRFHRPLAEEARRTSAFEQARD
jgi:hypothetical protein